MDGTEMTDALWEYINSIYLAILGRPADEEGIKLYVQHIQDGTMHKEELETALRESEEYREKIEWIRTNPEIVDFIKKTYLDVLHRSVDMGGLFHYVREIKDGRVTKEDLSKILLKSSEGKIEELIEMKISIIGSGFVGQEIGNGFLEYEHGVIFYDVIEKDLPNFTTDLDATIADSGVSFICVPTPTDDSGRIDLRIIRELSKDIGLALAKKEKYHLVVVVSTVVPRTTEEVIIPIIEESSSLQAGRDFGVCMTPEFLTEIAHTWSTVLDNMDRNFLTEDRIVIGELDKQSGDILEGLYRPLNIPIFRTDLKTAELIKYASNCMLATKISYWNEIFLICEELGIDSQNVADIVSHDLRIGKYGSVHGKAFGGKCLPKDLKAFISFAGKTKLLKAVDDINEEMKEEYGVRE